MKTTLKLSLVFMALLFISCGGKEEKKEPFNYGKKTTTTEKKVEKKVQNEDLASTRMDLTNKGIGPIKSVELGENIDQAMVTHGAEVYKKMCTACHRPEKKFIGPAPKGILERRTPEWIMNMILNPEEMVQKDPLAKDLLIEFNGSPMANQNLTEEEARAVLEYFRTLK
ncbi:cytochrome c [Mangrovimonas sp. AS39]|uniref:c-type cytochrome n=1 Tax=Mangrovimonas futianensis TaxID=2895523 RepID=UPI001E5202FB|nr:cytochrome c [Mangrovimonas futianensis]MCF1192276.1 cytochrome c [Mangrovimonas futianensis]MCF1195975.1 cytochrome c [Mangrovimonas futianensis]MCF1422967.1 cytochrome c [Mangrovimonas futianensis]